MQKTVREYLERVFRSNPTALRILQEEAGMLDAPMGAGVFGSKKSKGDGGVEMGDGTRAAINTAADAAKSAFTDACVAVLNDDAMDLGKKLSRLRSLLIAKDKLVATIQVEDDAAAAAEDAAEESRRARPNSLLADLDESASARVNRLDRWQSGSTATLDESEAARQARLAKWRGHC